MLWMTGAPSLVFLCAIARWFTGPKTVQLNLFYLIGCTLYLWAFNPELARELPSGFYSFLTSAVFFFRLDRLVVSNARMLGTGVAVVWLLRRAFQTLWKPVPELIGILGLEVPDSPDVSLTGIAADKATLTWTRAQPSRPVQKFLIQVNGVNVGEIASNQDNFIIVSGLKPDHFYNVRVIAVGANNFQAGSRVIRLRTFARDGKPQLGNARVPSNFSPDEQSLPAQPDGVDENGAPRSPVATVETATVPEAAPPGLSRDAAPPSTSVLRRNTIGRRHSPSTTSVEQPPLPAPTRGETTVEPTEAQIDELGEKYKALLRETEDLVALIGKEEEDHKQLVSELEAEKQAKKKEQKKKEEQTEKLRREQGSAERSMRNALQRRTQKEKLLKEKQAERTKLEDKIANFEKGIEEMRKDQESFAQEKKQLEEQKRLREDELRAEIEALLSECGTMEMELKERRTQVKELEDARKRLPGGEEDAEWREKDVELRKERARKEKELQGILDYENRRSRQLDEHLQQLSSQLQQIQIQQELYANSSGVDFGDPASTQMKRRSRTGNSMSNVVMPSPAVAPGYTVSEVGATTGVALPGIPAPVSFIGVHRMSGPPGFAAGPFNGGMPADAAQDARSHEAELRALMGDAPLSPTAKSLLPSHIFMDMDDDTPGSDSSPFVPPRPMSPVNDPQSPSSSNRSMSILSSPHSSTHNLPFPPFAGDADRRSIQGSRDLGGPLSSPLLPAAQPAAPGKSLASILKFQRSRGVKPMDEEGPALGSLKPAQSQSLPRQTDESETLANRRRISLSSWGMFNRNSAGPELLEGRVAPPPANSTRFSARNLFAFGGTRPTSGIFPDRDPSSPRPASIASSDLPRPSTENGAIWGPPADSHVHPVGSKPWPWSPPENAWSSRNPSRRPSLHGSPSALKTTLASADDEILDEEALMNHAPPSQVGVIGSRPPASKKAMKTLNPAAPTFMTNLLNQMTSKDKSKDKTKDAKDKEKEKDSHKAPPSTVGDESPSDSRISRDALSVHTQTSVSESRESLSLDQPVSNTTLSDAGTTPDSVVKKLFRKGSSSKFSFSSRLGGSKKGPGSIANSDKNNATEQQRSSIGDLDDPAGFLEAADELGSLVSGASATNSPSLGPFRFSTGGTNNNGAGLLSSGGGRDKDKDKDKDRPDSRTGAGGSTASRWFSIKKKGREKDSLEIEREKGAVDSEAEDKRRASKDI